MEKYKVTQKFIDAQIIDKRSRKMMNFTRALRIEIWRM